MIAEGEFGECTRALKAEHSCSDATEREGNVVQIFASIDIVESALLRTGSGRRVEGVGWSIDGLGGICGRCGIAGDDIEGRCADHSTSAYEDVSSGQRH